MTSDELSVIQGHDCPKKSDFLNGRKSDFGQGDSSSDHTITGSTVKDHCLFAGVTGSLRRNLNDYGGSNEWNSPDLSRDYLTGVSVQVSAFSFQPVLDNCHLSLVI